MKLDVETWEKVQQLRKRQNETSIDSPTASIDSYKRLATFPSPGKYIRTHPKIPIPVVVVNTNVYILPGIPGLFQTLLYSLLDHIKYRILKHEAVDSSAPSTLSTSHVQPFYRRQVATKLSETLIAQVLSQLHDDVQSQQIKIGSYPVWNDSNGIKVVVSIVGKDLVKVEQITKLVMDKINGSLLPAKL